MQQKAGLLKDNTVTEQLQQKLLLRIFGRQASIKDDVMVEVGGINVSESQVLQKPKLN